MKRKIYHIASVMLLLIIGSCVSEFNPDLPPSNDNILVIEGDIIANSTVEFILSKTFDLSEEYLPEGYNNVNAEIVIVGSDGFRSNVATYIGNGVHTIAVGDLKPDVSYSVEIKYNGETYISDPEKPLATPEIDEVTWAHKSKGENVTIHVSTTGAESGYSYYMWDYIEDWEYRAYFSLYDIYDPIWGFTTYDYPPYYYCWRRRRGNEILIGATESLAENRIKNQQLLSYSENDQRMSLLYSIRLKQQAISKRAYEYYQNRAKMSNDTGGLFTPQPSELRGNITCVDDPSRLVIGYINVSMNVTNQQMYINSSELEKERYPQGCRIIKREELVEIFGGGDPSENDFYYSGYRPLDIKFETWAEVGCADCRMAGGTKNKPYFWPNDHK